MPKGRLGGPRPIPETLPTILLETDTDFDSILNDKDKEAIRQFLRRRGRPKRIFRKRPGTKPGIIFSDKEIIFTFSSTIQWFSVSSLKELKQSSEKQINEFLDVNDITQEPIEVERLLFSLSVFGPLGINRRFAEDRIGLAFVVTQIPPIGEEKDETIFNIGEAESKIEEVERDVSKVLESSVDILFINKSNDMMIETTTSLSLDDIEDVKDVVVESMSRFTKDSLSTTSGFVMVSNDSIQKFIDVNF